MIHRGESLFMGGMDAGMNAGRMVGIRQNASLCDMIFFVSSCNAWAIFVSNQLWEAKIPYVMSVKNFASGANKPLEKFLAKLRISLFIL